MQTANDIKLQAIEDVAKLTENQLVRLTRAREVRKLQIEYYEIVEKNTHYSKQYETKDVPSFGKAFGWMVISGLPLALAIFAKLEPMAVVVLILLFIGAVFAAVSTYFKALEINEAKERLAEKEAELRKHLDAPK